ncbi:hypothetical protein EV146_11661 [Mesobacillus foraminis]|uniref:Uncharacterized protein n=1 Tax=Mesobacillus foraminis TaxID=279826 RepID=A0A4R2B0J3_9BACI|nr:hypothetical protein EV146_11661 [Mesobacillus foraminis]
MGASVDFIDGFLEQTQRLNKKVRSIISPNQYDYIF